MRDNIVTCRKVLKPIYKDFKQLENIENIGNVLENITKTLEIIEMEIGIITPCVQESSNCLLSQYAHLEPQRRTVFIHIKYRFINIAYLFNMALSLFIILVSYNIIRVGSLNRIESSN